MRSAGMDGHRRTECHTPLQYSRISIDGAFFHGFHWSSAAVLFAAREREAAERLPDAGPQ